MSEALESVRADESVRTDPSAIAGDREPVALVDRTATEIPAKLFDPNPAPQSPTQPTPPSRPSPDGSPPDGAKPPRRRHMLRPILMAAGIGAVAIGSGVFWLHGGRFAGTDDAYVQAAKLVVATDVSGLVASVNVREGQPVAKGDLLYQLDLRQFQIARADAKARLDDTALSIQAMKDDYQVLLAEAAAQEAQVALDQATFDRVSKLKRDNFASKANFDQAQYALELDKAKLASLQHKAQSQLSQLGGDPDIAVADHPLYRQAQAAVDEARRALDHASVRAPFAGVVTRVDSLQPGDYLVAQTAGLTGAGAIGLVATDHMWVTAQMKETDLTFVKPGDPVTITVDTYPGQVWHGTVESISPATGSEFSVLPAENASGNWVKVVQRIPVRIQIETPPGAPVLRAGMSATVAIDTGHRRSFRDLL